MTLMEYVCDKNEIFALLCPFYLIKMNGSLNVVFECLLEGSNVFLEWCQIISESCLDRPFS